MLLNKAFVLISDINSNAISTPPVFRLKGVYSRVYRLDMYLIAFFTNRATIAARSILDAFNHHRELSVAFPIQSLDVDVWIPFRTLGSNARQCDRRRRRIVYHAQTEGAK